MQSVQAVWPGSHWAWLWVDAELASMFRNVSTSVAPMSRADAAFRPGCLCSQFLLIACVAAPLRTIKSQLWSGRSRAATWDGFKKGEDFMNQHVTRQELLRTATERLDRAGIRSACTAHFSILAFLRRLTAGMENFK